MNVRSRRYRNAISRYDTEIKLIRLSDNEEFYPMYLNN